MQPTRYHRISHNPIAVKRLLVDLFVEAHRRPPKQIILDLDATDDPLHGHQEGRFFHGYYDGYCYLPLYVFCGRHLLAAKLRKADIDASAGSVEEIARIVGFLDREYVVEGQLRRQDQQNIQRLKDIGCYRGFRHRRNLPTRGQRTRTNARTRKGPRKTVAGKKGVKEMRG